MSEEMTPEVLQSLVPPLLDLCRQAGDAILHHYHAPGADQYRAKGDDSPLTRADLDSHAILKAGLADLAPQMPLLSEEFAPLSFQLSLRPLFSPPLRPYCTCLPCGSWPYPNSPPVVYCGFVIGIITQCVCGFFG